MATEILDAFDDAARWHSVLSHLPAQCRDIYFRPEYVRLHLFQPGSRALLFAYRQGMDTWAYPFVLHPISRVGEEVLKSNWFDIESAYGYGGPLSTTDARDFIERANLAFASWCDLRGVVSEFMRLHPLLMGQKWLSGGEVTYDRETVSLDLNRLGVYESLLSSTTRNKLRRAERLGVRVAAYPASEGFDRFRQLYLDTMKRIGADDYYHFSDAYFRGLGQLVKETGWLYVAALGHEWISAALFLKGQAWMHYHLSASSPDRRVPGATNLVLFTAAQVGRHEGLERLHLGGGRTADPDDSLLDFKKSMATDSHRFYISKRIRNPEAYTQLRELWAKRYPHLVAKYGTRLLCYRHAQQ
ncbi:MAG: GNAT family N-acetyltransferase [candidate division NC10 bacterium]|nr:GNAT family N-acetyltransferase [candidate division NC10 bacterium]MDE2321493.1 GNAT family N-acetyltransferase [candidate division NC10 bacterium]